MNEFYTDYKHLIDHPVNVTFKELRQMPDPDFEEWVETLGREILFVWDELGSPPCGGVSEQEIISDFKRLDRFDVSKMLVYNEETFKRECIVNNPKYGSKCSQFFPGLLKTAINNVNGRIDGKSLYDSIKDPSGSLMATVRKNFKRDSFNQYSTAVLKSDWSSVRQYISQRNRYYAWWYDSRNVKPNEMLTITKRELDKLGFEPWQVNQGDYDKAEQNTIFKVREFPSDIRLFPQGLWIFKRAVDGTASIFLPTIAKYIWSRYTQAWRNQDRIIVMDPAAGWGSRILGAMAVNDRPLHYVGADPNSNNWISSLKMSRYEYLATYYNTHVNPRRPNTFELFRCGSEVIDQEPRFQAYRGKIAVVFTSPAYWRREIYCNERTQSCIKFPTYDQWRDGYLKRTLEICAEYLKVGGYLIWNIADVNIGGKIIPLEQDSLDIMNNLGLTYAETLKMVISVGPGLRTPGGGIAAHHQCKVNGKTLKYEPIFVYRKDQAQ